MVIAMKKYLLVTLITILFIAIILAGVNNPPDTTIRVLINGTDTVRIWSDEDNGISYVFLPSYAELESTSFLVPDGVNILIEGVPVLPGTDCSAYELNKEYCLEVNGDTSKTICFLQSANVATLYVDTISGNMDKVHRDKSYKEYADVVLYTSDGKLDYQGDTADKIRGHGNITTWELDKKSYNLYLHNEESLLSMSKGDKYILLANRTDNTNLRNKLILDFARKTGSFDGFSPDCMFVDLYLNREYNGLYLLCTSVESAADKIGKNNIRYIWDTEMTKRAGRSINVFEINTGISAEVKYPKKINEDARNYLIELLAGMQNAVQNLDGIDSETGKYWYDYIDLDSWARKYLIEEIFMNYDAVAVSQYYFLKNSDDKIYAGYCWDYDNSLGLYTHTNPNCFLAQRLWKNEETYTPWYHFLWKQQDFREYVIDLYKNVFSTELQELMKTVIPFEIEHIRPALYNNALRWNIGNADAATAAMAVFLNSRVEFLNSAWIDGVEYKTITLTGIEEYRFFCTAAGTACMNLPSPEDLGVNGVFYWTDKNTGEIFDKETVIIEDTTLWVDFEDVEPDTEKPRISIKITIISIFLLGGILIFASVVEARNRRR